MPPEIATTRRQREIIRHSLFGGSSRSRKPYRNYYCVSLDAPDDVEIGKLVAMGLMVYGHTINDGKQRYAFVTDAGAAEIGHALPEEAAS